MIIPDAKLSELLHHQQWVESLGKLGSQIELTNAQLIRFYRKSAAIIPATTLPESMTIGTPPPGWVVPPAK